MQGKVQSILGVMALVAASAGIAFASPAQAATRIVTQGNDQKTIVSRSPSGSLQRTLFRLDEGFVLSVGCSRDGRRIAFVTRSWKGAGRDRTRTDRIWAMDGSGRGTRVVKSFTTATKPWRTLPVEAIDVSPDGRLVLLTKSDGIVFLMRYDGSRLRQVRVPGYRFGIPLHPNWSGAEFTPDGRGIIDVFHSTVSREERTRGIGTVPLRGGRVHFLRSGPLRTRLASGTGPTMSPDGRFIAFAIGRRPGREFRGEIVLMRRDGSGERTLAQSRLRSWIALNPSFSPSGGALVFAAVKTRAGSGIFIGEDPALVFTIRRDGTQRRVVQSGKARSFEPNPLWTLSPF
jgi:WD40 repeat protein